MQMAPSGAFITWPTGTGCFLESDWKSFVKAESCNSTTSASSGHSGGLGSTAWTYGGRTKARTPALRHFSKRCGKAGPRRFRSPSSSKSHGSPCRPRMYSNKEILTLFHTVRHLKGVQIYHRAYRRKPWARVHYVPERRPAAGRWKPAISRNPVRSGPFRFHFLNQERELQGWNDKGIPKLWLYNLHYFDSPDLELMQLWVRNNPAGMGNGWEPYPLSRRIVNWIKWERAGGVLNQV